LVENSVRPGNVLVWNARFAKQFIQEEEVRL
jgi:hypothetical protein